MITLTLGLVLLRIFVRSSRILDASTVSNGRLNCRFRLSDVFAVIAWGAFAIQGVLITVLYERDFFSPTGEWDSDEALLNASWMKAAYFLTALQLNTVFA